MKTREHRTWDIRNHTGWGNRIGWLDIETLRLSGHTTPLPEVGDELLCPMQSGKIGRYRFTEVKPCYDPPDMWFGTVEGVGYADETE